MLGLILWACTTTPVVVQAPVPERVPIEHTRPTTRGDRALEGLNLKIQQLQANPDRTPKTRAALVAALSLRMSLTGQISDLDRMLKIAKDTNRAQVLMALHRFDEALALDPKTSDAVDLARQQNLPALEAKRRAALNQRKTILTWQALADVLAAQGKLEEADEAYWNALDIYRNVSPLTVADIQFRRGLLWGETGADPARARALYTDAVQRLPGFVRAQVHLAELEWQAGEHAAAIARVRPFASAEDPEPRGKLATWLEGAEAERWRAATEHAYEVLLKRHPLAFSDHAAEYYLAIGNQERARELAKINLDNRATRRAKQLCERANCP